MDFENVIRDRFSVRSFKSDSIDEEKLNKILEAGRIAPTAKNKQPQRIFIIKSKEGLAKIDQLSPCRYGAPVVLLVCADNVDCFKNGNFSSHQVDASIVTTHMMLEATNLGVDNIWVDMFDFDKIKEVFNLENNIEPICLLVLGYKAEDAHPSHLHNSRKELSETVKFL